MDIQDQEQNSEGFSLIELLVVVAIISIIAAVAIPALLGAYQRTLYRRATIDVRNIATSLGIYDADQSYVPEATTYAELIDILDDYTPHIDELPTRDPWKGEFYYTRTGINAYTLKCFGKDRIAGDPATDGVFDPNDDIILIDGVFVAIQ